MKNKVILLATACLVGFNAYASGPNNGLKKENDLAPLRETAWPGTYDPRSYEAGDGWESYLCKNSTEICVVTRPIASSHFVVITPTGQTFEVANDNPTIIQEDNGYIRYIFQSLD